MIFTHDRSGVYGKQKQSLAYSKNGGDTWIKYSGNPIISNAGDAYTASFRDPKVVRLEKEKIWLMVVAGGNPGCARLFTSSNLIDWKYNSDMKTLNGNYIRSDCPTFEKMYVNGDSANEKWVYTGAGRYYVIGELVKN